MIDLPESTDTHALVPVASRLRIRAIGRVADPPG